MDRQAFQARRVRRLVQAPKPPGQLTIIAVRHGPVGSIPVGLIPNVFSFLRISLDGKSPDADICLGNCSDGKVHDQASADWAVGRARR